MEEAQTLGEFEKAKNKGTRRATLEWGRYQRKVLAC